MQLALLIAQDSSDSASILPTLFMFAAIGFVMYLLLIRPQRRKMREQAQLQASIGVGDEVITTSGVYGFITGEDEENGLFWLEVDDDVQIRIAKAAIQSKVNPDAGRSKESERDRDDDGDDGDGDDDQPELIQDA